MPLFKFEDFIFDSTRQSLTHKHTKVAIRPKALKLLSLLIEHRHRIVPKSEIMSSVWGSDYARDHLLFQLISELRKSPLKSEFVRTQPNEGYQWNVPTHIIQNRVFVPKLVAASFISAVVCLSLFALPAFNKSEFDIKQTSQLPAFSAFSNGVIALDNGEKDSAIEWFEFALLENPDSVESSLFLAETLYQQNRPEEASVYLKDVLENADTSAYNQATATDLLSRIREQQGRYDDALLYAQKSIQTKVVGQCSIDFFEQRIQLLESELGPEVATSLNHSGMNKANVTKELPLSEKYIDQCEQLKDRKAETSSCQPLSNEADSYAKGQSHTRTSINKVA